MTDDSDRFSELEGRISRLEDLLAIYRMVASYGPAVDSNSIEAAASLWTDDGEYNLDVGAWAGRDRLCELFEGDVHQGLVADGCAHVVTLPRITVDGDSAVVTCYQQMIHNHDGRFEIDRLSANRWELERTIAGWKIGTRISRKLDGDPEARVTLARGFHDGLS